MIERLDLDSMKVFTARAWFVLRGAHKRRDDASIGASVLSVSRAPVNGGRAKWQSSGFPGRALARAAQLAT